MTKEQKFLYAFGLIIIGGIIAVGSFSLGVYTGKGGWVFKQPALTNPAQKPRQAFNGPANLSQEKDQNLPPKPDLIGKTISISRDSIEINTRGGVRSVNITSNTIFLKQDAGSIKPALAEDIRARSLLAVIGDFGPNDRTLTADIIILLDSNK